VSDASRDLAADAATVNRRAFLAGGAATVSAASYGRIAGANDRVGVGFIGYGLIGKRHVLDFQKLPDVAMVAVAEAHSGRLDEATAAIGGSVRGHRDFRRLLDDRDIDAVVVSTPDHWHALMAIMACAAGKDVYVEKPATLFVREGRWMVEAARRHQRIVQVGTQQRSGPHYQRARELIRAGHIGDVRSVRLTAFRNIMPGFGSPPDQEPPAELDWTMFLGPAAARAYNPNRGIYHFRWFWDTSGGQMTNLGQHSLDLVHWFLDVQAPVAVTSVGGRHSLVDNGETPDIQDAIFEYARCTVVWSHREAARGAAPPHSVDFFGPKGSLSISRKGFVITPDPKRPPEDAVPQFGGAHPVGGPRRGDKAPVGPWTTALRDDSGDEYDQFARHARNFVDCVKSRSEPVSDVESGHRVATACHLANLSLRLGRTLRWDAENETVIADREAEVMLVRGYRAPWDAALRASRS
jgi:predicted dehydrogenase